jgi:TolB-like protein/class 3 adenylate cyclase/tetratricopeptide (TPR) repeat protein
VLLGFNGGTLGVERVLPWLRPANSRPFWRADVAGYSRLAAADEERTLARLRALRSDLFDPTIALHHGRVIKRTGDGILIEFRSVVDAVRCAIEVQNGMVERNAGLPPERRIEFRIGIHLGDVVEESDSDLMGDGVNIAARLEGIARPGAICLSEDAYRQVKSRLDVAVRDLGSTQLKNIAEPVHIYSLEVGKQAPGKPIKKSAAPNVWLWALSPRMAGTVLIALAAIGIVAWQVVERIGAPSWESSSVSLEAQRRGPTIAVLPFDNLSGDPSQDFFSDGISEQLITALSHFEQLRVLARNTTFAYKKKAIDVQEVGRQLNARYVIEGSFRRVADQISVTAQLIDARTGTHLWAQSFERPTASSNLLAIQDDIAQRISAAVGDVSSGAVVTAELERTRNKPASELSSYECVLSASRATPQSVELVRRARICLDATVKRDPTYADAWMALAHILQMQRYFGAGLPSPEAEDSDKRAYLVPRAMEAASRAVELARQSANAHLSLFYAYWMMCQPERMRVEAETILVMTPNDANALGWSGLGLIYAGESDYGLQLVEKAIALAGPAAPGPWWGAIGDYHLGKGEYAKALELFRKDYIESYWVDHMRLIAVLPYLGRVEEARAEIPAALKLRPDISVHEFDRYMKMFCLSADHRGRVAAALRLAGFREEADENRAPQADAAAPNSQEEWRTVQSLLRIYERGHTLTSLGLMDTPLEEMPVKGHG